MDNFNMKQWLIENKSGMYSKTLSKEDYSEESDATSQTQNRGDLSEMNPAALGAPQAVADTRMQAKDDQNGDWVDNASMDVVAERRYYRGTEEVEDEEITINGVDYIITSEVNYEIDEDGDWENWDIVVKQLGKGIGDEYVSVKDPAEIANVQEFLNKSVMNAKSILNRVDTSNAEEPFDDSYEDESRYDETVGYVMKTKSPGDKQFFPGNKR